MDSEYSDQPGQMPRLIRVFTGCKGHFVGFFMRRLISEFSSMDKLSQYDKFYVGIRRLLVQQFKTGKKSKVKNMQKKQSFIG